MKSVFYSFMVGLLVGGGICYLLLSKSTPAQATMTVSSSDPLARITNQSIVVKSKRTLVEATASFKTDRAGTYTNTITINRRNLQFNHSIYAETGYWMQSQMPFISLSYSYQWLLISAKVGYSFRLQTIDYGLGIGVKYSF